MKGLAGKSVLVTGGGGFLGRRIVDELKARDARPIVVRSADYDLTRPEEVRRLLDEQEPQQIVHAAAVVGGIGANRRNPAQFFYANAVMGIHLLEEARRKRIEKVLVVGTVCSYPKYASVPFTEGDIWDGYPEETNAPYGLAKKMLLVQSQAYRSEYGFNSIYIIPTNLYGPEDNFDLDTSHVIPAMIRKCVDATLSGASEIRFWGSGAPSREFLYVDDAADGIVRALERYDGNDPVNLGSNHEIRIRDLATKIAALTGFDGNIVWDTSQPDGQPRRAVDGTRAGELLGWTPRVSLEDGLARTIDWYREHRTSLATAGASAL